MPLREDLLNPISGDNPSGANLRYDPVTDKIKEARREDIDAPQGEWKTALKTADYRQVIKLAGDVVATRSKDLQIAVWLVDAYVHQEGFALLAPSFQFLRDLLDQFWDTLYPDIDEDGDMEVRAAPLDWLGNKLGEPLGFLPIVSAKLGWHTYQESRTVGYEADADTNEKIAAREARISEGKVSAEQFDEALEATPLESLRKSRQDLLDGLEAVEALNQLCDEKFGSQAPSFVKTREAIEEIAQTLKILIGRKPGGAEEEAGESSEDATTDLSWTTEEEPPPAEARAATHSMPAGAPGDLDAAGRQLGAICKYLRGRDPEDPAPYLILRSFAWAGLEQNAPQLDHSTVEAPPGDLRVNIKKAAKEFDWDQVLELTESAMLQPWGRTWLDMQRYAVNALEQKGFPATARVVNNCLRVLLEQLPDILDLTLPDDTPAANPETRDWIQNFVIIQRVTRDPNAAPADAASSDDSSSSDYSFGSTDDSFSSTDTSMESTDTSFSAEPTPEPEPEPEPEAEPFVPEENPPILEAEEPPPSDESDEFGEAMAAVRDGRITDGLEIITGILATERSGRARFRRRTQLAHLLMVAGKGKVASSILDELAGEIDSRHLEDWEQAESLAYPLELLLRCLGRSDEERKASLYARICKLDPVRGVKTPI